VICNKPESEATIYKERESANRKFCEEMMNEFLKVGCFLFVYHANRTHGKTCIQRKRKYTKRANKMKNEKKMERKRPRASIKSISQQIRQNVVDFTFRKIVQL
jgi:hypothetical protein